MRNSPSNLGIAFVCTLWLLTVSVGTAADLELADRPLLSSNNVPPNILVAVDDSGSMDWETLFPTNSGLLYWNSNAGTVMSGGDYIQSGGTAFAYLFPNGCNNGQNRGQRIYCDSNNYGAVPPIPQFGFVRSSQYNAAYFDPTQTYTPWVSYDNATPSDARTDPTATTTIDLTSNVRENGSGELFSATRNMVVPAGTEVYYDGRWLTLPSDTPTNDYVPRYTNTIEVGVKYFPATFYMPSSWSPPGDYGWRGTAPLVGYSPDMPASPNLRRYEIKRANFSSGPAYDRAIQNFANWFTYYRKRHLATRAGITNAFADINGARVGACTINEANRNSPADLNMLTLNSDNLDNYETFNEQIFNINYFSAKGTPNRPALKFLGEQLKTNRNIIQSSCQRNYAILFTDGYNTSTVNGIGNADQGSEARQTYGAPFGDQESNTIADVAMNYYEKLGKIDGAASRGIERNQLRVPAGCGENPPDPWLDCETDLHMVTLGVTLGQRGVLFDPDAEYSKSDPYTNPPDWSGLNVTSGAYGNEQIDDLWHATINSRGKLLNAKTPQEVATAFTTALEEILYQDGSLSGVVANSRSLASDTAIYQASYTGGLWQGYLKAYALTGDGIAEDPLWEASEKIPEPDERVILTSLDGGSGYAGKAFRKTALESLYDTLISPQGVALSADIVDYIRGDQSNESSNDGELRNRYDNVLGDIVQSTPTYVGSPERVRYPVTWSDKYLGSNAAALPENGLSAAAYSDPSDDNSFAEKYAQRDAMVYVGANDGMLHGFDANSGVERLAYIPGTLLDDVADLSQPDYDHRFYVDGTPVTGDVFFKSEWHTVLVSGLNNGGNAVFALDITNPDSFSEANADNTVLWEYADPDGLGQTYGQPSIVRLHNGKWAAVFGNGYSSPTGSASLYLVDIASGTRIRSPIDTNTAPTGNKSPNGLSEVTPIDVDGDFITDYVYAGDLYGNMWRFDLTSKTPSEWSVKKLFTARGPGNTIQPITMAPEVGVHPYGRNYGVMVYFGTGKYLEDTDALFNEDANNSFYGVWDAGVFRFNPSSGWTPNQTGNFSRSDLQAQTITEVDDGDRTYRVVSDTPVPYKSSDNDNGKRGWYMDMPANSGELLIDSPVISGDLVVFSTLAPPRETCDLNTSGAVMAVRADSGARTVEATFDLNGDYQYTASDFIAVTGENSAVAVSGIVLTGTSPVGGVTLIPRDDGTLTYITGTTGTNGAEVASGGINSKVSQNKRVSWREIRR